MLWQPQLDKPFEVEVDASGFALGGVLLQRQEGGKKHPIGYYSATLNKAQRNYDIYKLELLAIAECLKHWRPLSRTHIFYLIFLYFIRIYLMKYSCLSPYH